LLLKPLAKGGAAGGLKEGGWAGGTFGGEGERVLELL